MKESHSSKKIDINPDTNFTSIDNKTRLNTIEKQIKTIDKAFKHLCFYRDNFFHKLLSELNIQGTKHSVRRVIFLYIISSKHANKSNSFQKRYN
jgi:predicted transcriptional regulator